MSEMAGVQDLRAEKDGDSAGSKGCRRLFGTRKPSDLDQREIS